MSSLVTGDGSDAAENLGEEIGEDTSSTTETPDHKLSSDAVELPPDTLDKDSGDSSDSDDEESDADSDDADPSVLAIDDEEASMSDEDFLAARLSRAGALKSEANEMFVAGDNTNAKLKYKEALLNLDRLKMKHLANADAQLQADALRVNLNSNLAAVHNRLEEYEDSIAACDAVLRLDACASKALFRRSHAQFHRSITGAFDKEARADALLCIKQDPKNKSARKLLTKIRSRIAQKKKERLEAASGMFNTGLYDDIEKKKKAALKRKREEEEAKKKEEERLWKEECERRKADAEEPIEFSDFQKMLKEQREEEEKIAAEKRKRDKEERRKRMLERDSKPVVVDVDDDESGILRGYKKTKDGRTTSYFTREIEDDKTRELLAAAQAPKRLPSGEFKSPAATGSRGEAHLSEWNAAGTTWESRDCTESAKQILKNVFSSPECRVSTGGFEESRDMMTQQAGSKADADVNAMLSNMATMLSKVEVSVVSVNDIEGSATRVQKATGIGHMFEWNFKAKWEAILDPSGGLNLETDADPSSSLATITTSGWVKAKDFSDHNMDFETSWGYSNGSKPKEVMHQRAIESAVQKLRQKLLSQASIYVSALQ